MRIVSYRGSHAPGGVSSALTQLFQSDTRITDWWSIAPGGLEQRKRSKLRSEFALDDEVTAGHYRFCNNFLWPVMHEMPQFVHYLNSEHRCYSEFNEAVATHLMASENDGRQWFINDYQFALLPAALDFDQSTSIFWHIPWPSFVDEMHVDVLAEIVRAMLRTTDIGFHTAEYVENFEAFVSTNLSEFDVDVRNHQILPKSPFSRAAVCTLHAAPLGSEKKAWSQITKRNQTLDALIPSLPFVLSVDRGDYTKGVFERLNAIEIFFEKFPEYRQNLTFMQICTRSREGLEEFDLYWQLCNDRVIQINNALSLEDWKPIIWCTEHQSESDLAEIYAHAAVMLVSPLRDGLNLTAKEYILSQSLGNGVLALSRGAGVHTEIGGYSVTVDPSDPFQMADAIFVSLNMGEVEKQYRLRRMREKLHKNSLSEWWQKFRRSSDLSAIKATSGMAYG
ncbi:trehalose-6-phosphate synthase [soil metagenome]